LTATVEKTIYHNQENGYTVLVVTDGKERFVATCTMPFSLDNGQQIDIEGQWVNDPKYGRQLKATAVQTKDPTTAEGIKAYLSSGIISGIGPATSERIVFMFGADTLTVLDENPNRLLEVKGIGNKTLERISSSWKVKREGATIISELCRIGLSITFAVKVYKQYGSEAVQATKDNPYKLADEIWGIGFKKADEIASHLGFVQDHPFRVKSGILFALKEAQNEGHCYLPRDVLIKNAHELLQIPALPIDTALNMLIQEKRILETEQGHIYMPPVYIAERFIETKAGELSKQPLMGVDFEPDTSIEQNVLTSEQHKAALTSVTHHISVITGSAGTGKTTTLKSIIKCLETNNYSYRLCAPTGKAAKRMTEVTGVEAKTIHRLLEYDPSGKFRRNEENPFIEDFIVVDEASMIDVFLAASLFKALPSHGSLVFIGDPHQLPPVGPGNFFNDLIISAICPVSRLSHIMRQKEQSNVITIANEINNGIVPVIPNEKDSFFFKIEEPLKIAEKIVELTTRSIPEKFGIPFEDIQVISPMKNGPIGTRNLNELLQKAVQKDKKVSLRGFMLDDKVMQIANNYKKEVFNGDIGFITFIDTEEQKVYVKYEGKDDQVEYEAADLDELTLAYATTVHKYQGSETRCVIFPVHTSHYVMLRRNLLYTAVTRTMDKLIMLGTQKALAIGVKNINEQERFTGLFKQQKGAAL